MRNILATTAVAALMAGIAVGPADAGKRHYGGDGFRGYHSHDRGGRHHGRGYWRDGKWIALGILGAAAVGALDNDDDCYRNSRGRVVCR